MKVSAVHFRPLFLLLLFGSLLAVLHLGGCGQETRRGGEGELAQGGGSFSQNSLHGQRLYLGYCFVCHGQTGQGDGPYAEWLRVPPSDLTARSTLRGKDDQELYEFISKGGVAHGRSVQMRPFGMQLSRAEILDIVSYIRVLNEGLQVELEGKSGYTSKQIYDISCVMCHGEGGTGDGDLARKLGVAIRPLGSSAVQLRSDGELQAIIAGGIADPARPTTRYMPSWEKSLTPAQIDSMVAYIRSFQRD